MRGVSIYLDVNWFRHTPALYFENARLVDPLDGETRGTLRVANGRIASINTPPQRGDIRFDLDGALVLPGLVNAHDHLELNNFPRWKERPCYANAREWALETNARLDSDPDIVAARAVPLADRLLIGGLKNLLAGVTTVAHHNPFHAPLRHNFPVRVVSRYGWSHSLYLSPHFAANYRRTPLTAPYMIHLAEGTDAAAQQELDILDKAQALQANTVLIHGVGLTPSQRALAMAQRSGLVWCPSSNFFLLGATATVNEFSGAHLLGIGSDSRLTGERDLLDELRVARETKQVSGDALVRAISVDAAAFLRLTGVGRLTRGARADLIILPNTYPSAAEAIGVIRRDELRAVIIDGTVRVADPDFARLIPHSGRVKVDGRDKVIESSLAQRLSTNSVQEQGVELQ